ncbi:flagellar hook assembly protein FlgD [Sporosarcina psychrophila]|uniref:flagellar hook assembly protein FlgD n=1 Tax=Sporosarcina psychrophila TaxID=1476 RepID=UPI00078B8A6E|nr:flagellar hook assembly protein FlgD [Sporosarcina psychrophila]AMQ07227.1 flagellar biosynthesis protein FlgD [Sporosarcina psychrophila]
MAIEGQKAISGTDYLVNKKRDERKTGDGVMGKDDFMKLLIAQLQNQDPTNPMKDNEFIAQMAQFSALEQTMNLSKSFEKFAEAQGQSQLIQYNSFAGKEVRWHELRVDDKGNSVVGEDGNPIVDEGTNRIVSVKYDNGSVKFIMDDGKELTPGNISEVMSGSSGTNSLVEASMLIGKKVGYIDGEEEKIGIVASVSNKDGKLQYILEDGTRIDGKNFTSISK